MPARRARTRHTTFAPPALRAVTTLPPPPASPTPRGRPKTVQPTSEPTERLLGASPLVLDLLNEDAVLVIGALLDAQERAMAAAEDSDGKVQDLHLNKAARLEGLAKKIADAFAERGLRK